jgi:hypothetical protein
MGDSNIQACQPDAGGVIGRQITDITGLLSYSTSQTVSSSVPSTHLTTATG